MILVGDGSGVFVGQHPADAFANLLVGLPIATGGKRIAKFPVVVIGIRIPVPAANAINQFRADPVAFDREGVIGIGDVYILNMFEIGIDIVWPAGCFGETRDYWFAHSVPHQA